MSPTTEEKPIDNPCLPLRRAPREHQVGARLTPAERAVFDARRRPPANGPQPRQ